MKILVRIVFALAILAAVILLVGLLLPEEHTAAVEARYRATPDEIYAIVADVEAAPAWRGDLQRVDVLSREGEPLTWREVSDRGTLTFVREVDQPGRRIVTRIVDEGQGHHAGMEAYARDLGARLGETVTPVRVPA
ncbi:MAG TPA: SRPBCC family protein [Longimicrobiales bacterium]|nr:SRPBCC family protein [Longimicrobiales bacterium]